MGIFNRFNPCLCVHAEIGVYVLSYCQMLYLTGFLVMGGALGYTTLPILSRPDSEEPVYRKIILTSIVVMYFIYLFLEAGFHEYLHKSLNLSTDEKLKRCRCWILCKCIMYVIAIPIVAVHLFLDLSSFKIVLYAFAFTYQAYYIWVVHHYTVEVRRSSRVTPGGKKEESESYACCAAPPPKCGRTPSPKKILISAL